MKKAVIYVRGQKEKMQEMFCRLYAADMDYKVMYVTTQIEDVNLCDVLLISSPSRISRNNKKYYEVVNELKARGIEVESVSNYDDSIDYYSFAKEMLK